MGIHMAEDAGRIRQKKKNRKKKIEKKNSAHCAEIFRWGKRRGTWSNSIEKIYPFEQSNFALRAKATAIRWDLYQHLILINVRKNVVELKQKTIFTKWFEMAMVNVLPGNVQFSLSSVK